MSGPVSDWHAICSALKRRVDSTAKELGHGVVGGAQCKLHADRERQRPLQDRARTGGRDALQRLLTALKSLESSFSTASATVTATAKNMGTSSSGSDQLQLAVAVAEAGMPAPMRKSPNDFAEIAVQV